MENEKQIVFIVLKRKPEKYSLMFQNDKQKKIRFPFQNKNLASI